MKLKISEGKQSHHVDSCTAVGWSGTNELYSCSEDKTMCKWNLEGETVDKVMDIDAHVMSMHWYPSMGNRGNSVSSEILAIACSNGSFQLLHSSGRVEKVVKDAHKGAVTAVRWNHEGTALMSSGEDGIVKIWSRGGQHRANLASTGRSVFSLVWGPKSEQALFTNGKDIVIKSIHMSSKQSQWKAHEGPVTKVDWNSLTGMIVSAGEEGKFKVWDSYGRCLYASKSYEHSIMSVSWSPRGDMFAVGLFNAVRICDKTGWTHTHNTTNTGSILDLCWATDGTKLAMAGGNGAVCSGELLGRKREWKHLVVSMTETDKLHVHDILNDTVEILEFRDVIVTMSLSFGYLVVVTSSQCWVYDVSHWNMPHTFNVKDTVSLVLQSKKNFLLVDNSNGLQIFTYEGRPLSNPKFSGLRTEFLDSHSVSISTDVLAVIDKGEGHSTAVRLFDIFTGKQIKLISHEMEITEVSLSQFDMGSVVRIVALVDRNRDLYITTATAARSVELFKLATIVDSICWNDNTDMLAATGDGKFMSWIYPAIVFVDRDLLPFTLSVKGMDLGRNPCITSFFGTRCTVRQWNGSTISITVSPYSPVLYGLVEKRSWEGAIRLCRFVKDQALWATLAAMAIKASHFSTTEVALAAINAVDKLQYILYIQSIQYVEGRNAELALYMRRLDDAEAILRQAGLIYRAIKMNIRLYNWNRALEMAVSHKTHLNTVLAYRRRYLESQGRPETNPNFQQYESTSVDWDSVQESIKQEKEKSYERQVKKF